MKWTNIKDEWPKPNSEVVVYYLSEIHGIHDYFAEFLHEKLINQLVGVEEVYWAEPPSQRKE